MENVLLINNPNSGRRQALKHKKAVVKFLLEKRLKFKSIAIDEIEKTPFDNFDTIIVIGGDGTVNKVLPHVLNKDKTIGIIPSGTANLLAAKLKIPTNVKKALKIIENGRISNIDILKINDKYSALRLGLGYDSDIICKTPQSFKNKFGYFAYFLSGILFALRLKQKHYTIFYDNKKLSIVATCIIAANAGNMFRNIFSISQKCELDDGLLDIFILKVKNPIMFFAEFLQIIFDKKSTNSKDMYFQTSNFKIKNDITTGHIDGEKQKFKGDIEINITPKSVKIFSNTTTC